MWGVVVVGTLLGPEGTGPTPGWLVAAALAVADGRGRGRVCWLWLQRWLWLVGVGVVVLFRAFLISDRRTGSCGLVGSSGGVAGWSLRTAQWTRASLILCSCMYLVFRGRVCVLECACLWVCVWSSC